MVKLVYTYASGAYPARGGGSSPLRPTLTCYNLGRLAQLVRASLLHSGGRGFESLIVHKKPGWRNGIPACRQAGAEALRGMFYVYILRSLKTGEFYKGITDNIDRRISEHMAGQSPTTKSRLPLELVHVEICDTRGEARNLEKYFKSGFGREIIREIAGVAKWYTQRP